MTAFGQGLPRPGFVGSDLPPDYGCHDIIEGSKTEHVFGFVGFL